MDRQNEAKTTVAKMKSAKSIRIISRIVTILKSFGPQDLELSVTDISRKADVPKATVYRIVTNLTQAGLLEKSRKTAKYKIGRELYFLGNMYLSTTDIIKDSEPIVQALNELTNEAVLIGSMDNGYVTVIMKEDAKHLLRWIVGIGYRMLAHTSAMGLAFLSELTDTEIDGLYSEETLPLQTTKTITTKTELKQVLDQIRKTKIAINMGGNHEEFVGIASVIRDNSGKAVAALCISLPIFRLDKANLPRLSTIIRLGSSLISRQLGYQGTSEPVLNVDEIYSWWEQD